MPSIMARLLISICCYSIELAATIYRISCNPAFQDNSPSPQHTRRQQVNLKDRKLRNDIVLVLVIKLILIMALWWVFFRGATVAVDDASTAAHLVATPNPPISVNGEPHAQ